MKKLKHIIEAKLLDLGVAALFVCVFGALMMASGQANAASERVLDCHDEYIDLYTTSDEPDAKLYISFLFKDYDGVLVGSIHGSFDGKPVLYHFFISKDEEVVLFRQYKDGTVIVKGPGIDLQCPQALEFEW